MKIIIFFILVFPITVYGQQKAMLKEILKNQKIFYSKHVPKSEKSNYEPILSLASMIRPKLVKYIETIDSSFFLKGDSFHIVEGYQQAHTHLFGLIWKSDSVIYTYNFNWTQPVEKSIKVGVLQSLPADQKEIIGNFKNWESPLFGHIHADMYTSLDGAYYLASTYLINKPFIIRTIAFYH